ncbi:MAG TPA: hypothetical protein VGR47_22850 [Terracidiphilus sp.]|nr:hypothetical protein [Terracidiphilus sp.]
MFDAALGPLFRYLIRRPRRNARPVAEKPPIARLKKRLPWTMRNLRPQVTGMRGRSDSHWRSFDLIFSTFRVHIVLRGFDPDDIVFSSRQGGIESRMDALQRALNIKFEKTSDLDLAIRNPSYEALDSFLCEYHEEIDEFYGFAG